MPEDHKRDIEQVTGELTYQAWIDQDEICARLGIGPELVELCLEWDIIHPLHTTSEGVAVFSIHTVDRLSSGLRLHRDLGINWAGVGIALDLLERIEELESQLKESFPLE
jgi:MerR HTH family regulatory protein